METKTTSIRVLIAEDSLVARELLVSILQNAPGLQVIGTARNGVEAVHLAKRLKPDVIAMDVYMPEKEGQYPVILALCPYKKEAQIGPPREGYHSEGGNLVFLVPHGYIMVFATVRGKTTLNRGGSRRI